MRDRGPGFAPFPRHGIVRVNDLVGPGVAPAAVVAALRAHDVTGVDRGDPVTGAVSAVVTATPAGTVITLQRRTSALRPRVVALRRLTALLDSLVSELDDAPSVPRKPGQNRTEAGSGGS